MSQGKDDREIKKIKVDFSKEEIDKITKNLHQLVQQCPKILELVICESCGPIKLSACHVCGKNRCQNCWEDSGWDFPIDCTICDKIVCETCGIKRNYKKKGQEWEFCNPCYNNESNRPSFDHSGKTVG